MSKIKTNSGEGKLVIRIFLIAIISILTVLTLLGKFTYNVLPFSYFNMSIEEKILIKEIHNLEKEYSKIEKRIEYNSKQYIAAWADTNRYKDAFGNIGGPSSSEKSASLKRYGDAIKKSRELFADEERVRKKLEVLKLKLND